jgi:NAD(P)-dependent dehydrogenase (short-subunit alcohol dehydrogenase family)
MPELRRAALPRPANSPAMTKTCIVTGGGYGIGQAVCALLAEDGWGIVAVDVNGERAAETVALIARQGGVARAIGGDVTDASTAWRARDLAEDVFGGIAGLVNCAGMRHPGSVTDITEAQWDETVDTCLKGTFLFCRAVVPSLIANGGGSIVNFSSGDAAGRRAMVAYSVAKAGVEALTKCMAVDYLGDHIRVNAIVPGFTLTGMTEHYPPERLADMAAKSVAGRLQQPRDVAQLVRFLLSLEAETMTGGIHGGVLPNR